MISVLCPTRRRWDMLAASLASLEDRRTGDGTAEYLVAHDPDDPPPYPPPPHARFWEAPQRYGYQRLHEYYNALAAQAQGDWLFIWNDDARLLSAGWDEVIEAQEPALLRPGHNGPPHCNAFPVVPAEWIRLLGHVSLDPYVDTWLQQLAEASGAQRGIPVQLTHTAPDDPTQREGRAVTPLANYSRDGLTAAWETDLARLREHLR